jgi:hypothetical protein
LQRRSGLFHVEQMPGNSCPFSLGERSTWNIDQIEPTQQFLNWQDTRRGQKA